MKSFDEIVKGLKICSDIEDSTCGECPYSDNTCGYGLENDALELIEQQQKEIEQLKAKQVVHCGECKYWGNTLGNIGDCGREDVMYLATCNNDFCSFGERKEGTE